MIYSGNGEDSAGRGGMTIIDPADAGLTMRLVQLRQEHADLGAAIAALAAAATGDQLQIARLKKRKLQLKDEISRIEDMLLPDIIA